MVMAAEAQPPGVQPQYLPKDNTLGSEADPIRAILIFHDPSDWQVSAAVHGVMQRWVCCVGMGGAALLLIIMRRAALGKLARHLYQVYR